MRQATPFQSFLPRTMFKINNNNNKINYTTINKAKKLQEKMDRAA
jgi:hypothetical protein